MYIMSPPPQQKKTYYIIAQTLLVYDQWANECNQKNAKNTTINNESRTYYMYTYNTNNICTTHNTFTYKNKFKLNE